MDEKRKGEIAYALLKLRLKEGGFPVDNNLRREIGRRAKEIDIPFQELLEFTTDLAHEIITEVTDVDRRPTAEELQGRGGGH